MQNYELLSHFYLGKTIDPGTMKRTNEYLLYDSRDLTTHAICVGMTGSGKTGLGISILEEAAMDNIPALVIDPKGDMSNLLLTFPDLKAEDFMPWLDTSVAEKQGLSLAEFARLTAEEWQNGLAEWEQDRNRIRNLKAKADFSVYTPGSSSGKSLSVIRMLDCPNAKIMADPESLQDYATSTISALLSLLGIDADPLQSKEHILLSNILLAHWQQGSSLDLASLIQLIVKPDLDKVGVLPLEAFYPEAERMKLAMGFNNLLASPQFQSWLQGESLNIQNLLYTPEGKPRISILSINHLDDQERMFFVSTFLNQLLAWMRTQSGTSSLRALLYMDEIYGYFPPVAKPASKEPLLNLLKQARAFGLGIVLATQNPADLDYKGLSNIGTWFVGRLQTEQDKNRLLDGLQVASQSGGNLSLLANRNELSNLISQLPKRAFLMNNVHDNSLTLFATRWCMSYLAGPLTKNQIAAFDQASVQESVNISATTAPLNTTIAEETAVADDAIAENAAVADDSAATEGITISANQDTPDSRANTQEEITKKDRGVSTSEKIEPAINRSAGNAQTFGLLNKIPQGIQQYYLPADRQASRVLYLPSLYACVETTYENKSLGIFSSETSIWQTYIKNSVLPVDWQNPLALHASPDILLNQGLAQAQYAALPEIANNKTTFNQWSKQLVDQIYRKEVFTVFANDDKSVVSQKDESKADFIVRLRQKNREQRDLEIDKLRDKYEKKIATLEERIRKAEQAVEREKDQAKSANFSTLINVGNTLLDSLLGNKKGFKKSTVSKAASSARSLGRSRQQQGDVGRAEETVHAYQEELAKLESSLQDEITALTDSYAEKEDVYQEIPIKPLKKDILVKVFALLWLPHEPDSAGNPLPLFSEDAE